MPSGIVAPGFEPVASVLDAQIASGESLGAGIAAIRNGEVLLNIVAGHADRAKTQTWRANTIVPVFSATKPIAALVLAHVCDRASVSFDTPVTALWPEFAAHGKARLTLAQTLAHQAGLPGFVEPIDPALWLDPPALAAKLADTAPLWPPGSASGYHPTTWGYLVGEIVKRIDGRSLGAILQQDICRPRGITFWIGLPDSEDRNVAEIRRPTRMPDLGDLTPAKRAAFLEKWSGPDRHSEAWRRVEIPSANGHGGALALAQLYGLFVNGEDVLSPAAHAALTKREYFGQDLVLPYTLDWRRGVLGNTLGFFGPNPDALGHYGWGGSCGVADRGAGLSIGFVINQQSHHLMGDPRARALIDALYACL